MHSLSATSQPLYSGVEKASETKFLYLFSVPIFATMTFTAVTGIGFPYSIFVALAGAVIGNYRLRWAFFGLAIFSFVYFVYYSVVPAIDPRIELSMRRVLLLIDIFVLSLFLSNFHQVRIHRNGHILLAALTLAITLIFGLGASQNFLGLILIVSFVALLKRPSLVLALLHIGAAVAFESYTSAVAMILGYIFLVNYRAGLIAVVFGIIAAAAITYLIGTGSHLTYPLLSLVPTFYIRFALWHNSVSFMLENFSFWEIVFGSLRHTPADVFATTFTNRIELPFVYRGTDPHNIFINFFFYFGLFGLGLFLGWIGYIIRQSQKVLAYVAVFMTYFFFETSLGFTTTGLFLIILGVVFQFKDN